MLNIRNLLPRALTEVLAGAAILVCASLSAAAKAEDCLTDWGVAGAIVRRENLMSVSELIKSAAPGIPGTIIKTTLCKDGDDFIYKLVVRDAAGQLRTVVVDARPKGKASTLR